MIDSLRFIALTFFISLWWLSEPVSAPTYVFDDVAARQIIAGIQGDIGVCLMERLDYER